MQAKEFIVDPGELDLRMCTRANFFNHRLHRQRLGWPSDIVDTEDSFFQAMNNKIRHVANINDLYRIRRRPGNNHHASERFTDRPIQKTSRSIAHSNHESRTN